MFVNNTGLKNLNSDIHLVISDLLDDIKLCW